MPRIPRHLVLTKDLAFHKVWRGHNREPNLGEASEKLAYLTYLNEELEKQPSPLRALCLMSNHAHEIYSLVDLQGFSDFMRRHHGRYGQHFNRKHQRCGKVAQDRPHTSAIEDDSHEMMVTFYVHANPLRAGMVRDAKDYVWSTHRLYAFGKRAPWMTGVRFPPWYLNLGRTPEERQRKYRELFDAYLKEHGLRKEAFTAYGIGDLRWKSRRRSIILTYRRSKAKSKDPPIQLT